MGADPKRTEKETQEFLKVKKQEILQRMSQSPEPDPRQKDRPETTHWRQL